MNHFSVSTLFIFPDVECTTYKNSKDDISLSNDLGAVGYSRRQIKHGVQSWPLAFIRNNIVNEWEIADFFCTLAETAELPLSAKVRSANIS
jgi:hypothetical protein